MTDQTQPEPTTASPAPSSWYAGAMEHLVGVVQSLPQARDVPALARIVGDAARTLTGADGATFVLREGDECRCVEQTGADQVWKGKRYPIASTITGLAMETRQPVVIEDVINHPWIKPGAYNVETTRSLTAVPIRRSDPLGAIATYWATSHIPSPEEIKVLQALADVTAVAWENVGLFAELQDKIKSLQAQQARIAAQHESLEVFARALAHDLKEPVRTVRAFSDLIVNYDDPPETKQMYFELIRKASDRMAMLVDTVFQYSQLDDPSRLKKRPVALDGALAAATDNLAQLIVERGATVTSDPLPEVEAHGGHMMQVLQNLIANALRHGPLSVAIHVSADDEGNRTRITVRDNGPGLEGSDQERIFMPFKRLNLNEEGAGLGLATCRKIMALHGGSIWCESTVGEGASFHFALPKPVPVPSPDDALSIPGPTDSNGRRLANVLLVDDREADVELTRVFLQVRDKCEFNLSVARGGQEALDALRKAQSRGDSYDLLLLDINMPGMDGFEMMEQMARDDTINRTVVVMCSGSTYEDDLRRASDLGAAGYMIKPASLAQLKPMIAAIPTLKLDQAGEASRLLRAA